MQNTLVFMRTHIITRGVISEFLKLKKSGYDCVLFIDNRSGIIKEDLEPVRVLNFFGEDVNCFLFNEEIFKKLNLPLFANKNKNSNLTNVMWFCADYSFYCIKKYFPSYDFTGILIMMFFVMENLMSHFLSCIVIMNLIYWLAIFVNWILIQNGLYLKSLNGYIIMCKSMHPFSLLFV